MFRNVSLAALAALILFASTAEAQLLRRLRCQPCCTQVNTCAGAQDCCAQSACNQPCTPSCCAQVGCESASIVASAPMEVAPTEVAPVVMQAEVQLAPMAVATATTGCCCAPATFRPLARLRGCQPSCQQCSCQTECAAPVATVETCGCESTGCESTCNDCCCETPAWGSRITSIAPRLLCPISCTLQNVFR